MLISDISLGLTDELPHINRTMMIKRILKWLRRETPQQSTASEADQRDAGPRVTPEQKIEDEYSEDSSFNWEATDQIEGSGSRKGAPVPDQSAYEDTVPLPALELEDDPSSSAEEDIGVDPYNTGRFDTAKK